MIILIIIFLVLVLSLLFMLSFRAWEIRTAQIDGSNTSIHRNILPKIYFRRIEKIMLYLAKYVIQWIVLIVIKYFFILQTKIKKWAKDNSPKINRFFNKNFGNQNYRKNSFLHKAVLESKIKIRNMKERIIKEHEKELERDKNNI